MDILLSIPIISYAFTPGVTSWSTSMNILFFYMTWTSLVFAHSPIQVHISGLLVIRAIFWLIPSLIFLLFDLAVPSLAEGIKFGGRTALPPRNMRRISKMLGLALLNLVILLLAEAVMSTAYKAVFRRTDFKMYTTLPLPWTVFKHSIFILGSREVLHFYIHKNILHGNNWLARQHIAYAHKNPGAPCSIQLFTDHPLALVVHRLLPLYLPAIFLRPHMLTYFLVCIISTAEETLAMSGYTIIPGIIMSGITQRVSIHYAGQGSSNYAALGVLDWAHGTSKGRGVFQDIQNEAEKHHLQERSADKANEGANLLKDQLDSLKKTVSKRKTRTSEKE